jgi:hypothetical protein
VNRTDLETWEDNQSRKRRSRSKIDGESQQGVDFVTKLGAAKHALMLAENVPDITDLIDHADAVRAAAKALRISAAGVNAWMRFVVDAERKGWSHIEKMREVGVLSPGGSGGDRRSCSHKELDVLRNLIEGNTRKRAYEWSMLAKLTEFQLDEIERIANEEDRLLTRNELLKLAKAGMPEPTDKPEKIRDVKDLEAIARAQEIAASEGFVGELIQISDEAKVNKDEKGWWVEAWVFIEDELTRSDYDQD